jgi:hypothetical protein
VRISTNRIDAPLTNPIRKVDRYVGSIRRSATTHIFHVPRGAVNDVIDAHLETLSMITLTTCWGIGYGWFEAVIGIGFLLGIPGAITGKVQWYSFLGGLYSSYHVFLGFTIFCLTFGIGFLKFNRMLYARKRYLLFTSLASYPWALTVQDFSYFFFSPIFNAGNYGLDSHAWTCGGLGLGCIRLSNPWKPSIPFIIPEWYGVTLAISGILFFLAYRSALVNLLVTREVMKEIGFTIKIRSSTHDRGVPVDMDVDQTPEPTHPHLPPKTTAGEGRTHGVQVPRPVATPAEPKIVELVDKDREELKKRLCERLARQGP